MPDDLLAAFLCAVILGTGCRYLLACIRYIRSGQFEVDRRLREVTH